MTAHALTDSVAKSADRFCRDTRDHQMTVLHDDGPYRHIRFENGRNEIARFNLITWPNGLAIRGDGPNFMFAIYPTVDLFGLFRRPGDSGINPGYWEEKVVAGETREYSEDLFRKCVQEALAAAEPDHPGVTAAWADCLMWGASTDYEDEALTALRNFRFTPDLAVGAAEPFRFRDFSGADFIDWSWRYLWACHAIVWGIGQYDQARADAGQQRSAVPA